MQCPMACPGLATHTLAGLCALWLPSGAYLAEKLQKAAKPHQPPQTTCPARQQHPVQAPPLLLHTTETAFDLAVSHGIPRAGHSHTGRAVCPVVAEQRLLSRKTHKAAKPQTPKTTFSARPQHPVQAPPHLLHHTAGYALNLAVPHGMPGAGHAHSGRALCTVVAESHLLK